MKLFSVGAPQGSPRAGNTVTMGGLADSMDSHLTVGTGRPVVGTGSIQTQSGLRSGSRSPRASPRAAIGIIAAGDTVSPRAAVGIKGAGDSSGSIEHQGDTNPHTSQAAGISTGVHGATREESAENVFEKLSPRGVMSVSDRENNHTRNTSAGGGGGGGEVAVVVPTASKRLRPTPVPLPHYEPPDPRFVSWEELTLFLQWLGRLAERETAALRAKIAAELWGNIQRESLTRAVHRIGMQQLRRRRPWSLLGGVQVQVQGTHSSK